MPSAAEFRTAFLQCYERARGSLDVSQWASTWNDSAAWTSFMSRHDIAVLKETARTLGLVCARGEPMTFDAVFCNSSATNWFPITVAIEHENDYKNFGQEIKKLLSVRSLLKVGILYALLDQRTIQPRICDDVANTIRVAFDSVNRIIPESAATEYLFLVGTEDSEHQLRWRSLIFRGNGPVGTFDDGHNG